MIIEAKSIKPKESMKSDFFSWNLYRWIRKHPHRNRIWSATWNICTGVDIARILYVGSKREGDWIHCTQLRRLCSGSGRGKQEAYAYNHNHDTANWVDVTEEFWAKYMEIGVCAIHGDLAHKWKYEGNGRVCEYCGKSEEKETVLISQNIWRTKG